MQQPETVSAPPRVILADPDPATRCRLAEALAADFGHRVVGQAGDGTELLDVALARKPDAVVASLDLEQLPVLEALAQITEQHPFAAVVLAMRPSRQALDQLLAGPVHACLLEPASPAQIGFAVEFAWKQFNEQRRLAATIARLEASIADRKVVERAKGLLMTRHRWSEPEAFRRLQRAAMNRRVPMADLARQVLEDGDLPP